MVYILSNRAAGDAASGALEKRVKELIKGEKYEFSASRDVEDKREYLSKIKEDDKLIIIGGDGTLNRFVNSTDDVEYPFPIYLYAGGTGNDFLKDIGADTEELIKINEYLHSLPVVKVNGETYRFVNGAGLGFDGYCCQKVNEEKNKTGKPGSYIKSAISGLLGGYKKASARVTVDGVTKNYEDVWFATAMHGRFCGSGMMFAPLQMRNNAEGILSFVVVKARSALTVVKALPSVFKGTQTKFKNLFNLVEGKHIKVEFDKPAVLQMDGETICDVLTYEAYVPKKCKA